MLGIKNKFIVTTMICAASLIPFTAHSAPDGLTTFEEYADMTPKQQSDVFGNALGVIYGAAKEKKDIERAIVF